MKYSNHVFNKVACFLCVANDKINPHSFVFSDKQTWLDEIHVGQ